MCQIGLNYNTQITHDKNEHVNLLSFGLSRSQNNSHSLTYSPFTAAIRVKFLAQGYNTWELNLQPLSNKPTSETIIPCSHLNSYVSMSYLVSRMYKYSHHNIYFYHRLYLTECVQRLSPELSLGAINYDL